MATDRDLLNLHIYTFIGVDGKVVVQIETVPPFPLAMNEQPLLRVNINDGRVFEGFKDGHAEFGPESVDCARPSAPKPRRNRY